MTTLTTTTLTLRKFCIGTIILDCRLDNNNFYWRIALPPDENNKILLVGTPIEKIHLEGEQGFIYGSGKLEQICKCRHFSINKSSIRNINIHDVNKILGLKVQRKKQENELISDGKAIPTLWDSPQDELCERYGFDYEYGYSYRRESIKGKEVEKTLVFTKTPYFLASPTIWLDGEYLVKAMGVVWNDMVRMADCFDLCRNELTFGATLPARPVAYVDADVEVDVNLVGILDSNIK